MNRSKPRTKRFPCHHRDTGTHSSCFELYALDAGLARPAGLDRADLLARIDDHIMEQARIVDTCSG